MKSLNLSALMHHPKGLSVLFFTEFWERFSYYGMRAILILFLTATAATGGFEFSTGKAASVYGWYTSLVYATAIPGGWIADRLIGLKNAVFVGGILIMFGHFCLAFSDVNLFYAGLLLIVLGTGLLKPNVSALVGTLYEPGDQRRDAGFSLFYMGINLGAVFGPIVCGWLGQKVGWHYGFAAAGVGMLFGLIQYKWQSHTLPNVLIKEKADLGKISLKAVTIAGALALVIAFPALKYVLLSAVVIYMLWAFSKLSKEERSPMAAIAILFVFSCFFWGAFEQAGSSLNLFAERFTDNTLLGYNFASSWYQSVNAFFIVTLSPVFAWLWVWLGKREPSSPGKFAYGLWFVGLGFLVMAFAAMASKEGAEKVGPMWLTICYLLHTIGELCLSPVGLSTVTKLAPARMVGAMMGVWFLSISFGNKIGGAVAGYFETFPLPKLFGAVFLTTTICAVILVFLIKPIKKLMGSVH